MAQHSDSGHQVNLDVYASQDGTAGQLMSTQHLAPGQSFSNGDDPGVNAVSRKLAGWH
jgi:hypothetical protein